MTMGVAAVIIATGFFIFILAISLRIMSSGRSSQLQDPRARALATLNERYARGEIGRDEYLERRAFLE